MSPTRRGEPIRIQSRDNPRLRAAARLLASSRERRKAGRCVLEGVHLLEACLAGGITPETVLVDADRVAAPGLPEILARIDPTRILFVASRIFAESTHLVSPAPVIAVVPTPVSDPAAVGEFVAVLDDIQDPGNVGTILRAAAAARVDTVCLSANSAFAWSPKVLRAAQGAHFHLAIVEPIDPSGFARAFAGRVIGLVVDGGTPVFDLDLTGPVALVVGNEGAGLSAPVRAACTGLATIPMPGRFESLNAAMAATVCLFEKVRQERVRQG